ncbi:MAG: RNA-directed DNA polymerase [Massilia sp.]
MNKHKRLEIFLSEGFFAAQIPPCFSSRAFAVAISTLSAQWDKIKKERCTEEAAYERYSVARVGHNRRPIAITNPVAQFYLSRCIADEWVQINKSFRMSRISLSVPKLANATGRSIEITPIKKLQEEKLLRSAGARFSLVSDIAQFFPSIYTHSIAWALEGKENAKRKAVRNNKLLLGNRLDELCRYTQQNQTIGIPIGPDTSHILAELIGAAIDQLLKEKLGKWPLGFRHVDDFTFYFETETEASRALAVLFEALAIYELSPNIAKTKIARISQIEYDSWVDNFDTFQFSQSKASQRRDLHRFFDVAFALAKKFDDENVIQYALRRVETEIIKSHNWDVFSAYLMRCMDAYPNTIPECVTIVDTYHRYLREKDFPLKTWQKFVSSQIIQYAPFEKHSEVAWLLWLALRLKLNIERKSVQLLEQMKSSICLCLGLALEKEGLLKKPIAKARLPNFVQGSNLYGPHWLLMYEGAVQGWLPGAVPHVQGDRYFKEMLNRDMRFFDSTVAPPPIFSLKEKDHPNADRVAELLDSDENLYELFDFVDLNKDYLGRRAQYDYLEDDDEEEEDESDDDPWVKKERKFENELDDLDDTPW